ncbi:MAG: anti-sigma factor [Ignavibacteria bacterium]
MSIKDYISSGIIELYASGNLDEQESLIVEDMIRKNPEVKSEYEKIQNTLYVSAFPYLKKPSENIKSLILGKIQDRKAPVKSDSQRRDSLRKDINVQYHGKPGTATRYLMAASIAFLLLSIGTNFFLWTKLKDAKTELAILSDQKKIIVQEYDAVNRKLDQASKDMEILKDRDYKMVDLKGLEKSPNSNVLAFWNPENKKLFVKVVNLPVPPPDKQYQLWALSNGKPIDAGMMDVDPSDNSLHEMKSMDDAQAFAITLEPKGGSVNPTMDQMYVLGKL